MSEQMSQQMLRGGSGRRDIKGSQTHGPGGGQPNDGWSTVGAQSSRKPADLSKFGSVRGKVSSGSVSLGPDSLFLVASAKGWKAENKDREEKTTSMTRTNSTANMYNILNNVDNLDGKKNVENLAETLKTSHTGERKKLILAPRTLPPKDDVISSSPPKMTNIASSVPPVEETNAEDKTSTSSMSDEMAQKKIRNMVEEYFSILDVNVSVDPKQLDYLLLN